jgi:hypothetical protein
MSLSMRGDHVKALFLACFFFAVFPNLARASQATPVV